MYHLSRILEQYPPFMELCDKALGTSIYEDLPAAAEIKLTDF